MLVLSRRVGESLIIGDKKVTVLDIGDDSVLLSIDGSEAVTVSKWKRISLADSTSISLEKVNSGQVKLGVIAPDGVMVSREEVFEG